MDELEVMASIRTSLGELPDDAARARVLRWAADAAGLGTVAGDQSGGIANSADGSLNDLLDRSTPGNRVELILAVASWLESTSAGAHRSSSDAA